MGPATRRSGTYRGGTCTRWKSAARNDYLLKERPEVVRFVTAHHAAILRHAFRAGIQGLSDRFEKGLHVQRLTLIALEAGGHDRLSILGHGRGRHGDRGNRRGRRILSDLPERRDAVDPRQLD